MIATLNHKVAFEHLNRYFSMLKSTGYVKHDIVLRFLIYLFFIDFVDNVYDFITEEDYNVINRALSVLFSSGNCLLPYTVFCANRALMGKATIGRAHYMGIFNVRVTEVDGTKRITENATFRTV